MSLHKKALLRQLSGQEQQKLTESCCSRVTPDVEVMRAKILLAVARRADY